VTVVLASVQEGIDASEEPSHSVVTVEVAAGTYHEDGTVDYPRVDTSHRRPFVAHIPL
jgi:hypothetical protein